MPPRLPVRPAYGVHRIGSISSEETWRIKAFSGTSAYTTSLLKPANNQLSVEVTNTWRNRLAYDSAQPEPERKTWTVNGPGAVPLIPAGLLGPVNLRVGQILTVP